MHQKSTRSCYVRFPGLCFNCAGNRGILIQQRYRYDQTHNLDRSWSEFTNGFGEVTGNYWIGNRLLHELTGGDHVTGYRLRVDLLAAYDRRWYWAEYDTFRVGDEASGFRLTIDGYKGTAGDSLKSSNGMRFSTHDRDNDVWPETHCAQSHGGGFWYSRCGAAQLNAQPYDNDGWGFVWNDLPFETLGRRKLLVSRLTLIL